MLLWDEGSLSALVLQETSASNTQEHQKKEDKKKKDNAWSHHVLDLGRDDPTQLATYLKHEVRASVAGISASTLLGQPVKDSRVKSVH